MWLMNVWHMMKWKVLWIFKTLKYSCELWILLLSSINPTHAFRFSILVFFYLRWWTYKKGYEHNRKVKHIHIWTLSSYIVDSTWSCPTFVEAPYHYIYYFMFHILFIHFVHAWTLDGIYFNWIKKHLNCISILYLVKIMCMLFQYYYFVKLIFKL
jgi:hypothetical protein